MHIPTIYYILISTSFQTGQMSMQSKNGCYFFHLLLLKGLFCFENLFIFTDQYPVKTHLWLTWSWFRILCLTQKKEKIRPLTNFKKNAKVGFKKTKHWTYTTKCNRHNAIIVFIWYIRLKSSCNLISVSIASKSNRKWIQYMPNRVHTFDETINNLKKTWN